jgi:hypothetical protein
LTHAKAKTLKNIKSHIPQATNKNLRVSPGSRHIASPVSNNTAPESLKKNDKGVFTSRFEIQEKNLPVHVCQCDTGFTVVRVSYRHFLL